MARASQLSVALEGRQAEENVTRTWTLRELQTPFLGSRRAHGECSDVLVQARVRVGTSSGSEASRNAPKCWCMRTYWRIQP